MDELTPEQRAIVEIAQRIGAIEEAVKALKSRVRLLMKERSEAIENRS